MSQNFELLSQLEAELTLAGTVPKVGSETASAARGSSSPSVNQELINLAQAMFLSKNGNAPRAVVLCGVDEKCASGEICLALGRVLADCAAQPICLVDANVRPSQLSRLLSKERLAAVAIATGERLVQVEKNLWLTSVAALCSTRSDSPAPPDELKKHLEKLRESFAFILIAAPGVNGRSDATVLSQIANGAILIIEANSTRKAAALKAKQSLEGANIPIFGSVLNNRTFPIPERLYRKL